MKWNIKSYTSVTSVTFYGDIIWWNENILFENWKRI